MKRYISIFLFFFILVSIAYWGLWNTYFQQDEWFLFGRAIFQTQHLPLSLFDFASKHFWPLGNLFWLSLYKTFAFNSFYYAWTAIILHSIVSFLVWKFTGFFTKNKIIPYLLGFFFAISFPGTQPIVWFVVPPFLLPSIMFILLFMIYLFTRIEKKKLGIRDSVILFLLYLLSFSFREESMILIVLLPISLFLFWKENKRKLLKPTLILIFLMIFLVLGRFAFEQINGEHIVFEQGSQKAITAYNLVSIPPKMIVQNLFELEDLWHVSALYTKYAFPWLVADGRTIIEVVFEDLVMFIFIPIVFLIGYFFSKANEVNRRKMIFALFWIFTSSAIIAFGGRRLQFLESRYLYLGNIGVILLILSIVEIVLKTSIVYKRLILGSFLLAYALLGVYYYCGIRWRVTQIYTPLAIQRKSVISQILKNYPSISKNTVFLVRCQSKKDCISNGLVLPFQSGVGQMLMVIYGSRDEEAYAPFFREFYLWDWEAQGYKKINGVGFGYFRNKIDPIIKLVKQGKIKPEDVISLNYSYSKNKIYDDTAKTRQELSKVVQLRK